MSYRINFLIGILLTIIAGSLLQSRYCCKCGSPAEPEMIIASSGAEDPQSSAAATDSSTIMTTEETRTRINADPLVFYFGNNESTIELNQQDMLKFSGISDFLKDNPESKLLVTGHTDNRGDRSKNIKLSQERADLVKDYLVRSGVAIARITSSSKGPDEPVADNETAEGRAKNRRVVVSIQ